MDLITKQGIKTIVYKQVNDGTVRLNELYHNREEEGLIIYEWGELQITYFGERKLSYITYNSESENELQMDDRVCLHVSISFTQGKMNIDFRE